MSLAEAVVANAFELTTDPVALARAHQKFSVITGQAVEQELFRALQRDDVACAAEVVGPSGSGKSSCIMRVCSDIAGMDATGHEMLILSAGDAASSLTDPAAFAHHLVDVIRSQGFRFSTDVQDRLELVGARETEVTEPVRTHTGRAEGGVPGVRASYQHALQEAHHKRVFGQSAAQARGDLSDILKVMRAEGARPVVVIDDTDRFVDPPGEDGLSPTVDFLFVNAVRLLSELAVDFVVAVHPRFAGTDGYEQARTRLLRTRVEIPPLLYGGRNPLNAILAGHLRSHGIPEPVSGLVGDGALDVLYGVYFAEGRDLREVLRVTERAAAHAVGQRRPLVEAADVAWVLAELTD
ncbi:MAG: hypothetical protein H0V22_10450 [Solirubrobacterales bacterium]|jgi:hypothetical protein|nr:hypothetical protein [Solirubrobacterales bacterium]